MKRLVVVGDLLLDRDVDGRAERLSPDAPAPVVDERRRRARPGGAGLAAVLAARDGRRVTLVTALARDAAAAELRELLDRWRVRVVDLGMDGTTPEKVRIRADGHTLVRLDRGSGGAPGPLTAGARRALHAAAAVLVSDYGRGLAAEPGLRAALAELGPEIPVVWDPHPRGPHPIPGVRVVTPNAAEAARAVSGRAGGRVTDAAARARDGRPRAPIEAGEPLGGPDHGTVALASVHGRELARRWRAVGVCVTLGARGALLASADGTPLAVPAPRFAHGDPCGAGDRFASALAGLLADGELPSRAVGDAVAVASAFVASGGASALDLDPDPDADADAGMPRDPLEVGDGPPQPADGAAGAPRARRLRRPPGASAAEDAFALARRVRAAGGTVVATGGCFDLLHAGHATMLAAARSLGDCLIVCLNGDASVRRLKGPDRPVVGEDDRAALLLALGCVDAVAVFDEDVPEAVLRELRPHLFVKGGDYHAAELPEAATLAAWGGRAVTVPFVAGRSTTGILEAVAGD